MGLEKPCLIFCITIITLNVLYFYRPYPLVCSACISYQDTSIQEGQQLGSASESETRKEQEVNTLETDGKPICGVIPCKPANLPNAYCFLGKWFCAAGWYGELCDIERSVMKCESEIHDVCYNHTENGVAVVSDSRWQYANKHEAATWRGHQGTNDRADEHVQSFGNYESIRNESLGKIIEIGCGPWTQTQFVLKSQSNPKIEDIMLVDPNILNYIQHTPTCSYKDGSLMGYRTHFLVAGGEHANWIEVYDTIIMINVLEHGKNAYSILENLWKNIKPGALLIFHERWHDNRLSDDRYWKIDDNWPMQPEGIHNSTHTTRLRVNTLERDFIHFA